MKSSGIHIFLHYTCETENPNLKFKDDDKMWECIHFDKF